jgi:serine/threonine protein kinase
MATVYEAGHTVLPRRAALKVMHGELRRQPGMATRIVQEAAILDCVRHPGVVRVYDCSVLPDHRPWIAMELVEGDTLANRLHDLTVLPPVEVATLLGDVADVLASVHKTGVVHRDLKPDNLLCTPTDYDYPIRVLDWGVARLGPIGRLTIDGLTPGTPIYMSPEQATGRDVGAPCDIYSLGVIAYEALTGRPPFDGHTLAEVVCMHLTRAPAPLRARCGAPAELCTLVGRMLHKEPSARPTAAEVLHAARSIARELSQAYEEFELSGIEIERAECPAPRASTRLQSPRRVAHVEHSHSVTRARSEQSHHSPSDEVVVVDVDAAELEYGVTEMLPVVRQPRWTPDLGGMPSVIVEPSPRPAVAPRAPRDQVAGEIIASHKSR